MSKASKTDASQSVTPDRTDDPTREKTQDERIAEAVAAAMVAYMQAQPKPEPSFASKASGWAWKYRYTIALCCAMFIAGNTCRPFGAGGVPIVSNVMAMFGMTTSPSSISSKAPADPSKREMLAKAFRSIAQQIRDEQFKTTEAAMSALKTQVTAVAASSPWKPTIDSIDQYLQSSTSLPSLAGRLDKLAEAFR